MIKTARENDLEILAKLAAILWRKHSPQALAKEFSTIISSEKARFFLKYVHETAVGFAYCQLRYEYVEGTQTTPVGYLEGIFVKEDYRHQGYAKELLSACEAWAKSMGCHEFASDCEWENSSSLCFHRAMGFTEANRIICFTKSLS